MKLVFAIIFIALAGCTTIRPALLPARGVESFHGNTLNSGIGNPIYDDHGNFKGFPTDDEFVLEYNQLAEDYGIYLYPHPVQIHPAGDIVTAEEMATYLTLKKQIGKKKASILTKIGL